MLGIVNQKYNRNSHSGTLIKALRDWYSWKFNLREKKPSWITCYIDRNGANIINKFCFRT
jgi:hypothetical protein